MAILDFLNFSFKAWTLQLHWGLKDSSRAWRALVAQRAPGLELLFTENNEWVALFIIFWENYQTKFQKKNILQFIWKDSIISYTNLCNPCIEFVGISINNCANIVLAVLLFYSRTIFFLAALSYYQHICYNI